MNRVPRNSLLLSHISPRRHGPKSGQIHHFWTNPYRIVCFIHTYPLRFHTVPGIWFALLYTTIYNFLNSRIDVDFLVEAMPSSSARASSIRPKRWGLLLELRSPGSSTNRWPPASCGVSWRGFASPRTSWLRGTRFRNWCADLKLGHWRRFLSRRIWRTFWM